MFMKKNWFTIFAALMLGLSAVGLTETARAQVGAPPTPATPISQQDAMKKYPPPAGGYPAAERPRMGEGQTGGIYISPYSGRRFDCRDLKGTNLVLDPFAKKVFRLP
jgi:hypothetical protein